jgi:hypothetical protein
VEAGARRRVVGCVHGEFRTKEGRSVRKRNKQAGYRTTREISLTLTQTALAHSVHRSVACAGEPVNQSAQRHNRDHSERALRREFEAASIIRTGARTRPSTAHAANRTRARHEQRSSAAAAPAAAAQSARLIWRRNGDRAIRRHPPQRTGTAPVESEAQTQSAALHNQRERRSGGERTGLERATMRSPSMMSHSSGPDCSRAEVVLTRTSTAIATVLAQ